MLKKPFFTGISGGIKNSHEFEISSLYRQAGANTGNFLFVSALRNILGSSDSKYIRNTMGKVEEEYDYLAISAANWVNSQNDMSSLASFIESTELPCVVVGIGSQISFGSSAPKLKKGTERFLKIISERSKYISVRGSYNQEVLSSYGIDNTWVTGCPSIIGARPDFTPDSIKPFPKNINFNKVVLQGTRHGYNNKIFNQTKIDDLNISIYRYAHDNRMPILLQSEVPDMYFTNSRIGSRDTYDSQAVSFLEKVYGRNIGSIAAHLRNDAMLFWDTDEWFSTLSKYDCLVGTRIHGVISALLSGIPAILLAHDERTLELARVMNLPYKDLREVTMFDDNTLRELIDASSLEDFTQGFYKYKKNFNEFFIENGVASSSVMN